MATIVMVHGGWGGGWEWTPVARLLRARNHEVFTPTLTGLGDRAHLGSAIRLRDHIDDVAATFRFEEISDAVLCGHSYGGMVVTGVADRLADSIRLVTYLDAFVPTDGEAVTGLVSSDLAGVIEAREAEGADTFPYVEEVWPPEGIIPESTRSSYIGRMLPHPLRTMTEPVRLEGRVDQLPRAFVRCTGGEAGAAEEEVASSAARARDAGWTYREMPTPHDLHLFDPEGTAELVHELASTMA